MKNKKENLYVYETSTGAVEIEIEQEWMNILKDEDRKIDAATRHYERHNLQMDVLQESSWMYSDEYNPEKMEERRETHIKMKNKCKTLLNIMTTEERELVLTVGMKVMTGKAFASQKGISPSAVSQRRKKLEKKIKKYIETA